MKNRICIFTRVSTNRQDYSRQLYELTEYCKLKGFIVAKTIATQISGTKVKGNRPDLDELFKSARNREFDKVLVTEISRIGRNVRDIQNTIHFLHDHKIPIHFKNLGGIESLDNQCNENFVTNVIISIFGELAAEEKRLLSERTKSGLRNAVAKGKKLGRPARRESNQAFLARYPKIVRDLKKQYAISELMRLHSVSKNTILKIKRTIYEKAI